MYFVDGMTVTAISKKNSVSPSTLWGWIRIFAEENGIDMKPKMHYKTADKQSVDHDSKVVPEGDEKALKEEIRRLERELRREKLRADLNEEIINVAEQKFNIQIRKKAGAKQ